MNLSELFFFKVFECTKESNNKLNKSSHNEKNCYFYHNSNNYENDLQTNIIEKDRRREQISFSTFFRNLRTNLEERDLNISIDTIFEFRNKEKNFNLNYYTNKPSFQNYNNFIYNQFDCCKNDTEYLFHIKNYKKNRCKYYEINKNCKKTFCPHSHYNSSYDGNQDKNGINLFIKTINSWIEKNEIRLIEIIEIFNIILSFENKYLSKYKYQLNEIKKDFEPFLKFYSEYKNSKNINKTMNIAQYKNKDNKNTQRIMQEINRVLNPKNKKNNIYKYNNLFEVLKFSTDLCYLSSSDEIKSGELIKYIYAFLNSANGVIIYGGIYSKENDKYLIKGISIKHKEREKFKKWFNTEFYRVLLEYEDHLKYKIYDLANNNNEECILIIEIKRIKETKFLISSLKGFYTIKEDILKNDEKEKNKILEEKDIVELDTKQYIDLLRKRFLVHYSEKFMVNQKFLDI